MTDSTPRRDFDYVQIKNILKCRLYSETADLLKQQVLASCLQKQITLQSSVCSIYIYWICSEKKVLGELVCINLKLNVVYTFSYFNTFSHACMDPLVY